MIASELALLGYKVADSTVAKYMVKVHTTDPSQRWGTFIRNHMAATAACDFFVVPTATFKMRSYSAPPPLSCSRSLAPLTQGDSARRREEISTRAESSRNHSRRVSASCSFTAEAMRATCRQATSFTRSVTASLLLRLIPTA